jgi:hypothetical protein
VGHVRFLVAVNPQNAHRHTETPPAGFQRPPWESPCAGPNWVLSLGFRIDLPHPVCLVTARFFPALNASFDRIELPGM